MRKLCIGLWCLVLSSLISCTLYQHVTLNGTAPQNDLGEFVHQTDSLQVTYQFSGNACPLTINVQNKTAKPLYVNWHQSSVVFDDQSYNLGFGVGSSNAESFFIIDTASNTVVSGNWDNKMQLAFIPPYANISVTPMNLVNEFLPIADTDSFSNKYVYTASGPASLKVYSFKPNVSPLYFRCFITCYDNPQMNHPQYIEHEFWASDVYKSHSKPAFLLPSQYTVNKTTAFGSLMSGFGVLVLTIALLAIGGDT